MSENGTTQQGLITMADLLQVQQLVERWGLRHGVSFQGARDTYATLGYERKLTYRHYYERYKRGGIAKTIITAFSEDTWRLPPLIKEVDKADELTASPFEEAWEALVLRLNLWHMLERVDRLARLGHYAVLVLGLRGQPKWNTAASRVRTPEDLVYVQAFSEEHALLLELVSEDTAEFGKPWLYQIDFNRQQADLSLSQSLLMTRPTLRGQYGQHVTVHASRVIHVAENGLEDDLIGDPALQAVWNYLDDLDKLAGGTAEMVWLDAKQRIVAALRDGARMSDEDAAAFDDRVQQLFHGLRNVLEVQGMDIHQLKGNVPDASNNINKIIELIAGTIRMPKRRLLGSERGELASSEDEGNWLVNTIGGRQKKHAEPMILRQFIDRCIKYNILPAPRTGYDIEWPPLLTETELEKANTAKGWAEAIAKQAGPARSPNEVLPDSIFRTDIMGFGPEQEERIQDELGKEEAERLRMQPPLLPVPRQSMETDDETETDDTDTDEAA